MKFVANSTISKEWFPYLQVTNPLKSCSDYNICITTQSRQEFFVLCNPYWSTLDAYNNPSKWKVEMMKNQKNDFFNYSYKALLDLYKKNHGTQFTINKNTTQSCKYYQDLDLKNENSTKWINAIKTFIKQFTKAKCNVYFNKNGNVHMTWDIVLNKDEVYALHTLTIKMLKEKGLKNSKVIADNSIGLKTLFCYKQIKHEQPVDKKKSKKVCYDFEVSSQIEAELKLN